MNMHSGIAACGCSRRGFLRGAAGLGLASLVAAPALADTCVPFDKTRQTATSPDDAIARLKAGNQRLLDNETVNCDLLGQIKATASGQAPFAAIVGCIDSRVPPELIFDQRIGAVFTARIAGNFVNTDIIGSLEFATKLTGARAIVVLGHTACGAIRGAISNAQLGNLTATLSNIEPAVVAAGADFDGEKTADNPAFVQAVADMNAKLAAKMIVDRSVVIRDLVEAGDVKVVAAMQDVATGRVSFFE
ncbi:carbonic anhydrase family protein [Kaistia algarum]|uniref:carbonic anhydrase family protein n=1 Tax=Kaistia algarum TaxID=2083279 RepID=UPI002258945A|nr:carbonic anhydrase family protein [Kaistia algarum]MCX5512678.1 carbonic anhydrase family protein [Kaistia algarum]